MVFFSFQSCFYDNLEELVGNQCVELPEQYSEAVVGIMERYCYECHSRSTNDQLGDGIVLEGYDAISNFIDGGSLLGVIQHSGGFSAMPKKKAKMQECDIEKIRVWITEGAQDN